MPRKPPSQNPNPNPNSIWVQLSGHHEKSVSLERFIFIQKMYVLKIRMWSLTYSGWTFLGLFTDGGGKKPILSPPFLKSVTHILQRWNLAQLYLTYRRPKKCMNLLTHTLNFADISIFSLEIENFAKSENTNMDWILIHNF